ncbi:MAG: hypothetical protein ABI249_08320 [Ornithinibacter sp.]
MWAALLLVCFLVVPGIWFVAQCEVIRWLSEGETPRLLRPLARRVGSVRRALGWEPRVQEPLPDILLALELRRLAAEVRRVEEGTQPHPAARRQAALAAYDRVLLQLCETADLPTACGLPPLSARRRLELETGLVSSGVDW